jgi:acetyl esterase/lipase
MDKQVFPTGKLARRQFLGASGALVAATASMAGTARAATPRDPVAEWRAAPSIPLWPNGTPGGGFRPQAGSADSPPIFVSGVEMPTLHVFRPEKSNGRALLAIPGGAYTFVSIANEGVDIARDMTARGYTVFVLVYRLPGEGWENREDVPLQDAQRAVRLIGSLAGEMGYDPAQIYTVGFSAGGHLAATLATGFGEQVYAARDPVDRLSARPRAAGLIYPVISQTEGIGHAESTLRLLGPNPPMPSIIRRSPDLHVAEDTPPLFLVHAMDDPAVPLENSLLIFGAMRGRRRPVEAHFFERGGHGFGAGVPGQPNAAWLDLFSNWIDSHAA